MKNRRAIQLGLKNVISFSNGEDILRIDDLTEFVAGCRPEDTSSLVTPKYARLPRGASLVVSCRVSVALTLTRPHCQQGDHLRAR